MKNFLIAVIFVAVGVFLVSWGRGMLETARASRSWPHVDGTVLESRVDSYVSTTGSGSKKRRTTMYQADVRVRYEVEGQVYETNRVSLQDVSSSSAGSVKKIVRRYPKGKRVKVYYDPQAPAVAVLQPGASWVTYVPLGFGIIFAGAGCLIFLRQGWRVVRRLLLVALSRG